MEQRQLLMGLQEPYCHDRRIVDIPSRNLLYDRNCKETPRAAMYFSSDVDFLPLEMFIERDLVAGIWKTSDPEFPEIVVASVYMDGSFKTAIRPKKFINLLKYCRKNNLQAVLLSDSNAHNELWFETTTDERGQLLEDIAYRFNLAVMNVGPLDVNFTYYRENSQSIIDITYCSFELSQRIHDWHVTWEVIHSDHRLIEFKIDIHNDTELKYRSLKKGNWTRFSSLFDEIEPYDNNIWTKGILEYQSCKLFEDIEKTLDITHPFKKRHLSVPEYGWYDSEVEEKWKQVRRALDHWRNVRDVHTHDLVKIQRREYYDLTDSKKREAWQKYVDGRSDYMLVAKFNKALNRTHLNQLGILKDDDGEPFANADESLRKLTEVHFPGCTDVNPNQVHLLNEYSECDISDAAADWITEERVIASINDFGDDKTGGPDKLKPIVFKNFGRNGIKRLVQMYKASYLLGYSPNSWRESNVIFIPKPGKDDYSDARSFRPLSLMTFVFKIDEKVALGRLQETTFKTHPFNDNQHGFRKARSCDSALTNFVEYLEVAVIHKEYALAVFLDIQAAFDSVTIEHIVRGLQKKNVDPFLIKWYEQYLRERRVNVTYKGSTVTKYLTQGTPQGGVLSPIMWNICFDDFLDLFPDEGDVNVVAYADDAALVVSGPDPHALVKTMQEAIDRTLRWGVENQLKFAPKKTVAMLVTHKTKVTADDLVKLRMGDYEIPYSKTTKYLGVYIDDRLSWNHHLNEKMKKAKNLLLKIRNTSGKLWGISPRNNMWHYRGIVRPTFCFGSLVWNRATDSAGNRAKLDKFQRYALMSMGNFRKSTPLRGLEVITYTMPLWLHIKQEASMAYLRTQDMSKFIPGFLDIVGHPTKTGHRQVVRHFLDDMGYVSQESDRLILPISNWDKKFNIDRDSFEDGTPSVSADIVGFSDGSKDPQNNTGSGIVLYDENMEVFHEDSWYLGRFVSVFQSEVYAIRKLADYLIQKNCKFKNIVIYSDSRSALLALNCCHVQAQSVSDTIISLNLLSRYNDVKLRWVRGHSGHAGNSRADELAKQGAGDIDNLANDMPAVSNSLLRANLKIAITAEWERSWIALESCRQTKHFFPSLNQKFSRDLMRSRKRAYSILVQLVTGHNHMRRHNTIVEYSWPDMEFADCRFCSEDEESSFHLLARCPNFAPQRLEYLGDVFLDHPFKVKCKALIGFLPDADIEGLNDL